MSDTGMRTNCHSATLAAMAPLATPKSPSAAVRSVAGQRIHRNPDAADIGAGFVQFRTALRLDPDRRARVLETVAPRVGAHHARHGLVAQQTLQGLQRQGRPGVGVERVDPRVVVFPAAPHQRMLLEIARNFAEIQNEKHQEAVSQLARALAGDVAPPR